MLPAVRHGPPVSWAPPVSFLLELTSEALMSVLLFNLRNSYFFIESSKNSKLYIHFDHRDELFAMVNFVSSFETIFTYEN